MKSTFLASSSSYIGVIYSYNTIFNIQVSHPLHYLFFRVQREVFFMHASLKLLTTHHETLYVILFYSAICQLGSFEYDDNHESERNAKGRKKFFIFPYHSIDKYTSLLFALLHLLVVFHVKLPEIFTLDIHTHIFGLRKSFIRFVQC